MVRAHPTFLVGFSNQTILLLWLIVLTVSPMTHWIPYQANASSSTYSVSIIDYAFQPLHVNITTGTTVTWTYSVSGSTIHTVTSDSGTNQTNGRPLLDSGDLSPGQSYSYTFNLPGYYPYQCAVHPTTPTMNGWINVTGNPVTVPPPNNSGNSLLLPVGVTAVAIVLVLVAFLLFRRRDKAQI